MFQEEAKIISPRKKKKEFKSIEKKWCDECGSCKENVGQDSLVGTATH